MSTPCARASAATARAGARATRSTASHSADGSHRASDRAAAWMFVICVGPARKHIPVGRGRCLSVLTVDGPNRSASVGGGAAAIRSIPRGQPKRRDLETAEKVPAAGSGDMRTAVAKSNFFVDKPNETKYFHQDLVRAYWPREAVSSDKWTPPPVVRY